MENTNLTSRLKNLSPAKRALLELKLKHNRSAERAKGTIPRRTNRDSAPLSFAQQRLWFLNQLEPENNAYNERSALRLEGQLNLVALRGAIAAIVERHEVLRTTFILTEPGEAVQRIGAAMQVDLPVVDISEMTSHRQDEEIRRITNSLSERPFDLCREAPLRLTLIRLSPICHVLAEVRHHIASDGWSTGIFKRELAALYAAFARGQASPLAELPIQYADYALWQREWLQGQLERQLGYWTVKLENLPILELPADRPRGSSRNQRGARRIFSLSDSLFKELRLLSTQQGATLFMTLLAAFKVLLQRYTGQDDIVVGSPIAGRTCWETEELIGFFVNMLVLRTQLSGNPTFKELLARVRETALQAYEHQDLPFEKLVEELNPGRDKDQTPLFQVAFAVQNVPKSILSMPEITVTALEVEPGNAKFDLFLAFIEAEGETRLRIDYRAELFEEATIARLFEHYRNLLEAIAAQPDRCLADLPLLMETERHQLLVEWNQTAREYPSSKRIHRLFEEQSERAPDAPAVIFEDRHLTYRQLNARANQLAHYLKRYGVDIDVPVGICMEQSVDLIIAIIGILKAGGVYVPLDPGYPRERLAFMVQDCGAPILVTQQEFTGTFTGSGAKIISLDADWKKIEEERASNLDGDISVDPLAYIIYTSGSTGQPKGVAVEHRAVNRLVINTNYAQISSTDVIAQASNVSFDAATFEIWGALLNGACLVLTPKESLLTPHLFSEFIERQGITTLFLTTALFNQLVKQAPAALGKLRFLLFGGEAADAQRVRELLVAGPPEHLLHVYGPTETTTFATWYPVRALDASATTVPIGRPIANTDIYILDGHLNPVPVGVAGELYVGGPGVARGYLNRPALTDEKFISNPLSNISEAKLYRSGDLARYLPDGNIEFIGRVDHQVKIRGFRIELGEIETALKQNPAVRDSVVLAREDFPGEKYLAAYVVAQPDALVRADALKFYLRQRLPEYMVPLAYVVMSSLPLTPNGKVDRNSLPKPETIKVNGSEEYRAPRTETEIKLTALWAEVLKIKSVGIDDNFFELGGHSLIAVRLTTEMERRLDCHVPVALLFEFPTIRQLAEKIQPAAYRELSPVIAVQPRGFMPPFFCVHGYAAYRAIARQLSPKWPFYGLGQHFCGRRVWQTRVEDQARAHLKEIYTLQPDGPYYLAGHSIGGMIAYEIAQLLRKDGREIAFLGMMDTVSPQQPTPVHQQLVKAVWRCCSRLTQTSEIGGFKQWFQSIKASSHLQLRALECWGYHLVGKPLPPELLAFYVDEIVFRGKYAKEQRCYQPQPYEGRVDYFKAAHGLTRLETWQALTNGRLVVHEIPGTHLTMIEDAGAVELARNIRVSLDNAANERQRIPSRPA
jgi:amino acid adenylation domain-containing protein